MRGRSNHFFNNFTNSREQTLLHDLVIESISIYGEDMYYIPRELTNFDKLYGTDDQSQYNHAIMICVFIESVDGFEGDGKFMSKFGLEIRDEATFVIPQRTFQEEISTVTQQTRPNEGDLIYFPLNKKCFKISYVDKFQMFYPLGTLPTWKLKTELFEYSNEQFNTSIDEIDAIQTNYSTDILDYTLLDDDGAHIMAEDGSYITQDRYDLEVLNPAADNNTIQFGSFNFPEGSDDILDFSDRDPFSKGTY